MQFEGVIKQLIIMVLLLLTGYFVRKFKILDKNEDRVLSEIVVKVCSPFLILWTLTSGSVRDAFSSLIMVAIISSCFILFSFTVSALFLKVKFLSDDKKIIFRMSVIFSNASFLGFPLCYGIWGQVGLMYASVYSAVQDLFFWSLGIFILTGKTGRDSLKNLLNPNIAAIFLSVGFWLLKIRLPEVLEETFHLMGSTTVPLALLITGISFYNTKFTIDTIKNMFLPAILKLIMIPAVAGLILIFINIDPIVKSVLLLELSMPCAASIVVVSNKYNRDYGLASRVVAVMTFLSLITIPLVSFLIKGIY